MHKSDREQLHGIIKQKVCALIKFFLTCHLIGLFWYFLQTSIFGQHLISNLSFFVVISIALSIFQL